ncbi:5-methyltetrahydropteroyltriglutamate--homocysteine S-methyltransferase [Verrucosispora sp. WMMC514]|uniref:5-methyltetrahydropteroyltriglutamate-- homocysteine S-methyltransferase n=1 Tax=Verrucosispora sp. WMMC514 TaxID=3015156 RepID=UPI00248CC6C9|nr:5-methyltetrahydropteroyltriglutamate--homocysteine S-methyltransferase [Verrucosispora sp. WMMC514]WBB91213.1 5-methyltetrahydropteroyltriglutamate--homocysteine S-methyltransferase [Verrucosispora sp. WMMC514]
MSTAFGQSTVLGYPRIGANRELKKAVEAYWAGTIDAEALAATAAGLRAQVWRTLRDARLDAIPSNTFSYYDQMLDTAVAVGAVPDRFTRLGLSALDTYFAMARGVDAEPALELTKWFDTNYHYLVPEIAPDTVFTANPAKALDEYAEARDLGITTRPVFVGPATFLLLAKGVDPFARLDDLVQTYARILAELAHAGVSWVQLDEPAYAADRSPAEIDALRRAYTRLGDLTHRPRIFVATYFGDLGDALPALLDTPVDAVGLDLVAGAGNLHRLAAAGPLGGKTIVAGLVDGRNVWRTDLRAAVAAGATVAGLADHVAVSSSCSLLHVPVDLSAETHLDPRLSERLAFARQKVDEIVVLGRALRDGTTALPAPLPATPANWRHDDVRGRLAALRPADRQRGDYPTRAARQQERLGLPELPTTTIGSFPQTAELRRARAAHRAGSLDDAGYASRMRTEVEQVVRLQEQLGLDVLVHGEPERNDMVQYFGEQLDGFAATRHGWVQSYGSRCVRPPIIYGDVSRKAPMTVAWSTYAQSLTSRPVKGMLTGPVTILAWSFVRTDQPLADTADQVALALRDECRDLESAGIRVIQVDEPALRETLPLRRADQKTYLDSRWRRSGWPPAASPTTPRSTPTCATRSSAR